MHLLDSQYFQQPDVVTLAREMLGKVLQHTLTDGTQLQAEIVETEAYAVDDKACHAHLHRRTKRTETMFLPGGHAYVYLCYGIHHLLNIVTNREGTPEAVLIRGVRPLNQLERLRENRSIKGGDFQLTNGPGKLTQALGITMALDGHALDSPPLQLFDRGQAYDNEQVAIGSRIGVDYAGEDAKLPYRFWVKNSEYVSRPR